MIMMTMASRQNVPNCLHSAREFEEFGRASCVRKFGALRNQEAPERGKEISRPISIAAPFARNQFICAVRLISPINRHACELKDLLCINTDTTRLCHPGKRNLKEVCREGFVKCTRPLIAHSQSTAIAACGTQWRPIVAGLPTGRPTSFVEPNRSQVASQWRPPSWAADESGRERSA